VNPLPVVYLGPSLPLPRAKAVLDADYRPPVKRGDLPQRHDGTIVIIDGEFGQNLSVSPKEILRLLDRGTRVIGASSMGALRAAELSLYGMQGCGWVFDAYESGRVDADDEVAVAYSPDDLSCLTVPLVNVRHWLDVLLAAGTVDAVTARRLLKGARQLFYADRSEERLLRKWDTLLGTSQVQELLRSTGGRMTDVKADDAERALACARRPQQANPQEDNDGRQQTAESEGDRGARASVGRR
jgi:TfuA protein